MSCLALPKVMFNLRAVNTMDHQDVLAQYDSITRGALSRILGTPVSDLQWAQSKLPVAMGGLGLRAATDHASVAPATSLISAHSLVNDLLGQGELAQGELALPLLPLPLLEDITAKQGEEVLVTVESLHGMSQKNGKPESRQEEPKFSIQSDRRIGKLKGHRKVLVSWPTSLRQLVICGAFTPPGSPSSPSRIHPNSKVQAWHPCLFLSRHLSCLQRRG